MLFATIFAVFQFESFSISYAVTANNGAGGTFTYSAGSTNQQIALAACESVNGISNCSVGSCGYFTYYYKTVDGHCTCSKAIGTYEFIYSNTGYTNVGGDYAQSNVYDVTGNSMFVRKKGTNVCYVNDVWLLVNANLGAALNVATSITVPSYAGIPTKRQVFSLSATASVAGTVNFF